MITYRHRLAGDEIVINYYEAADDLSPIHDLVTRKPVIGFDTESTGVNVYDPDWRTRLAQFGDEREAHVLPYTHHRMAIADLVMRARHLVMHNGDHDCHVLLRAYGIPLSVTYPKLTDTLTVSKVVDPTGYSVPKGGGKIVPTHKLKDRVRMLVDADLDLDHDLKAEFRKHKLTISDGYARIPIDNEVYVRYAGLDPVLAVRLLGELQTLACPDDLDLIDYERRLSYIVAEMTARGLCIDRAYTQRQAVELRTHAVEQRQHAHSLGWPVDDAARKADKEALGTWLRDRGVVLPKTATGADSFNKEALRQVLAGTDVAPAFDAWIEAREHEKFARDYLDMFVRYAAYDGRLHPDIHTLGAQTGRMSVSNPPLQQLPRAGDVRGCLVADEGHTLVSADFAQIEFCVAAAVADETRMTEAIKRGMDLHDLVARYIYGDDFTPEQRSVAKRAGFGRLYGAGKATVARQTGVSEDVAAHALAKFDKLFPGIKRFARACAQESQIQTFVGRRVAVDPVRPWGAINYAIQSPARDVLVHAIFRLVDAGLLDYMWLFVHDEVLLNVPHDIAKDVAEGLGTIMSGDFYGVPIRAQGEIKGERWTK